MRDFVYFALIVLSAFLVILETPVVCNADAPRQAANDSKPFGIETRVPWTTSRVNGSPDPPPPYRIAAAFPKLKKFAEPLAMTSAPGSERLFVVERYGKIFSFANQRDVGKPQLFFDLGKVIYGLALHPQFQQNGYFYVTYVLDPMQEQPLGTRVSRFQARRDNRLQGDTTTEQIVMQWPSGGHNGGCLKFGPDGYLYIATGDSSGIADQYLTGQDLSNLPGAILRIDVNDAEPGRAYSIPQDNPFVDVDGARPEIWAYGLRQPWKIAFDPSTGDLWTGNVGQDLWEQVFLIERGGNYGWSVMEGSHPFRPERTRGPTRFVPPIVEHDHAEFRSITGGFVYHGSRLPELKGAYIYGDYDTGKIWMLRFDRKNSKVTEHRELVDSVLRLVGFAQDHAGELYLLDHMSGLISRLERNTAKGNANDFPRRLSETGLFDSVKDHTPAQGVIPYSVAAAQWCDAATKDRYLAIPGQGQVEFDGITYPQPAPGAPHGWKFPNGTVAFETISLETETGNAASRRRLETRLLHYERLTGSEQVGDQYWRGYTYVWNEAQTDAVLLEDPHGQDVVLSIKDKAAPGGERKQSWHFASRTECTVCHNMAAKYVLGINTLQMNRDHDYGGVIDNQLRTFEHIGLFTKRLPTPPNDLPGLVDYADQSHGLDQRARSYLHANCSHCHRKWGGGNAEFRLLASVQLDEMGIAGVRPGHGGFYIPDAQILAAGDPYRSVLLYRLAKLGPGRMPRLGSGTVDQDGMSLIHDWIANLPAGKASRQSTAASALLGKLKREARDESRAQYIDQMLSTTNASLRLMRSMDDGSLSKPVRNEVLVRATKHPEAHIRDLFERYLPEDQRTKRLGNVIRPDQILGMNGDAERGRKLFFEAAAVQCRNCHKIQEKGTPIGPNLTQIGKKYTDRARLLDTILNPSKEIEPKFRVYLVQTVDGKVHTGLLVKRDENNLSLMDAKNKVLVISTADVEQLVPQQQSLMPDLLLRDMTAQQVADLTEFLSGLK